MSHIARSLEGKEGRVTSQSRRKGAETQKICADFGTPAMKLKTALRWRSEIDLGAFLAVVPSPAMLQIVAF